MHLYGRSSGQAATPKAQSEPPYLVGRQEGKGIRPVKTWGGCWGGVAVSSVEVAPTWTVGASASIFFLFSTKIQKNDGV